MRPYHSSLKCTVTSSELLVLSREDFYRTFKLSNESWKNALRQAQRKEALYISRCRSYLHINKLVLEESVAAVIKDEKESRKEKPVDPFHTMRLIEKKALGSENLRVSALASQGLPPDKTRS